MKPLVDIGWILAVDSRKEELIAVSQESCHRLQALLCEQFPQFEWRVQFLHRHRFDPRGALDPLPLLEFGVQEKIIQRWDYALVMVTNALKPRARVNTIGIPSSALETAVLSSSDLGPYAELGERLVGLALHLLGHVWGLEHETAGPMVPPETPEHLELSAYPPRQQRIIVDRLEEVADKRLEERSRRWRAVPFYWQTFWADPKSILIDMLGYAPWWLPFQMGRLTAATAVSLIVLLLAAEAWEIGVNLSTRSLTLGSFISILTATLFIFAGQHLSQVSRDVGRREQLTRTRIVVFGTLLLGMVALWGVLFVVSYLIGTLMPAGVLTGWINTPELTLTMMSRQAAFMAIVGVLAGALGGNLEDEDELKAKLLYDEET